MEGYTDSHGSLGVRGMNEACKYALTQNRVSQLLQALNYVAVVAQCLKVDKP